MNNNNKVAEKVIWEDSISPDNEASLASSPSQMQTQPQMTFCYKCNNVIPGNSKFCPYCQTELYVVCPKCGERYSSQYPSCSQCGTNRKEYLELQRREQERKIALEKERKRQQEILERKRLDEELKIKEAEEERERQERERKYAREASERQQKETYLKENAEIMKTKEYETAFSLLNEAFDDYKKRTINMGCIYVPLFVMIIMFTLFCVHFVLGFILMIVLPFFSDDIIKEANLKKCRKYLQKYISNNNDYNNKIITPDLIDMVSYQGKETISDCCIIAYRKAKGLLVKYEWHSLS